MKKPIFIENHIYHIYNRGVEKRNVFSDDRDRFRFVHDLFEFNDESPAANIYYKLPNLQSYEVGLRKIKENKEPRKCIVGILAFCLMTNHFHLLLRQKTDSGIINFMQKLGTGYTNYFNKKHERVGPLFQGKFKAALVDQESHFIHLPYYIHTNPLDIFAPGWKNSDDFDPKRAIEFLESYRWSSYPDYIGKKNFPSVTERKFLMGFFDSPTEYKKNTAKWIKEHDPEEMKEVFLD